MRRSVFLLLVMLAAAAGCREPEPRLQGFGYDTGWMDGSWQDFDLTAIAEPLFFDLSVAPDGTIAQASGRPSEWEPMVGAGRAAGTRTTPARSLSGGEVFTAIVEHRSARDTLLAQRRRAVRGAQAPLRPRLAN